MTEDPAAVDLPDLDEPAEHAEPAEPVRTGQDDVDEVIRAVEELDDRPLEEHVGVFEAAHSRLRHALDADPEPPDTP